jgi:hypothetical protein
MYSQIVTIPCGGYNLVKHLANAHSEYLAVVGILVSSNLMTSLETKLCKICCACNASDLLQK